MKKFLFIYDCDGTISKEAFYKKMTGAIIPKIKLLASSAFKEGEIQDNTFLNEIFNNINLEESDLDKDILALPLDDHFKDLVAEVHRLGGNFIVLSSGCEFYIKKVFEYHEMSHIPYQLSLGVFISYLSFS